MKEPSEQSILGLGEVLWDCFADARRPGGAPANVAFHACQLGHRGLIVSRVGADDDGEALLADLRARGLDTRYIQIDARHPTGRVTVEFARPDSPEYTIRADAAWDYIDHRPDFDRLAASAAAVCFGTLAQRSAVSRDTIRQVLRSASRAVRLFDVNLRQGWYDRETIEASLRLSDIAKMNEREAGRLADLLEIGDAEPARFAAVLRDRYGVQRTCITRGGRGCVAIEGDAVSEIPAIPADVVDAVGAGDAFSAAILSGTLRGWPLAQAAGFANRVAALVVGQRGAMPPLGDAFAALVAMTERDWSARRRSRRGAGRGVGRDGPR